MHAHTFRTWNDVQSVSRRNYQEFMAFDHVYDALEESARRHGRRRALSYVVSADPEVPGRSWTYDAFLESVRQAAQVFRSIAGSETPRIAMLLPAIPEAYFTLWGGESVGVVCPINYMLDSAHIAELIDAAGANILVALGPNSELDIWSRVQEIEARCGGLRCVLAVGGAPGYDSLPDGQPESSVPRGSFEPLRNSGGPVALFHTGGTTGAPKLAQHTHANQLHAAWGAAQMYDMRPADVILNGFPMFHVAGAFVFGLSALLSGAEVVLPTLLGLRNSEFVKRYWSFVDRHNVSLLAAVPTVIASLNNVVRGDGEGRSVRALLTGGSPLPSELAGAFERRHGIPVRNILGMTECAGVVSVEPFLSPRSPGSCGLPLPFSEVVAFDNAGKACAPGESGVLRLRGPNVGPGYTHAGKNAGTFEDGWLITGDIGHVDAQGRVFVTGRAKDVIIRGAHNIDPQVIEDALLQHPAVQMAAAVGEPDEYAGELPVAFVTLRPSATVDVQELSSFVNARIPERPAYPKRIEILESIPTTAIGKVFKPRLRALAYEYALRQRLISRGLDTRVGVSVQEEAKGLAARFMSINGPASPADKARIADLMSPFAVSYSVESAQPLQPGASLP